MHHRGRSNTFLLVAVVLLAGFLAGCGGGGQSGSGSRDSGSGGQGGGGSSEKTQLEVKIALGEIAYKAPRKGKLALRPTAEGQGAQVIVFKLSKKTIIRVDGQEKKLKDLEKGQQANVSYVTVGGKNKARTIEVVGGGGEATTAGESTN